MSTVGPKQSDSSTIDDESYDLNGWWFSRESADSNQATKSDEQNTEEEKPSTQTTKYDGWWFEPATTEAAPEAASISDGNQAEKESEKPKCDSPPVDTKASGFEEFQAAFSRKFAKTYKAKEQAEKAAKEYKEWSDDFDYDYDSEGDFSEDDFSDSDSAIDETDPDQLD